jgi:hypothetical protein
MLNRTARFQTACLTYFTLRCKQNAQRQLEMINEAHFRKHFFRGTNAKQFCPTFFTKNTNAFTFLHAQLFSAPLQTAFVQFLLLNSKF